MTHKTSSAPATSFKQQYLILYNATSLLLWTGLFAHVAYIIYTSGTGQIYNQSAKLLRNVQSLAVLEVIHSLIGVVRAPTGTTAIQVASRLLLVWGIVGLFGDSILLESKARNAFGIGQERHVRNNQMAYLSMFVAWSITECVRYSYFVLFLRGQGDTPKVPKVLSWLRYNTFFVLYPIGITSEFWLIYQALPFANAWNQIYGYFLMAVLVAYIPGE